MTNYPNPYSTVIATFSQQQTSKTESAEQNGRSSIDHDGGEGVGDNGIGDEDDPQHLPDDDLLLWANAQFTFDNQSEKDLDDEMALKIAHSQQQQYQAAQQQHGQHSHQNLQLQQHQRHQPQLQQQQLQYQQLQGSQNRQLQLQQSQGQHGQHGQQSYTMMQPLSHPHLHQHQPPNTPQYSNSADAQRQLRQFDAIDGYLGADSQDPRTSLSLVERSRQRNPVHQEQQQQQQQSQYDPHAHHLRPAYAQQQYAHQPMQPHQQQSFHEYPANASPLPSPTAMHDYHSLQIHPPQHQQHPHQYQPQLQHRDHNNSVGGAMSSLSLSSPISRSNASSLVSHEEKLQQLENELQEYQTELAEERKLREEQQQLHQQQQDPAVLNAMNTDGITAHGLGPGAGTASDDGTGSNGTRSRSNSLLGHDAFSTSTSMDMDHDPHLSININDPDYAVKVAAAEEDKRRRNTAASARFRQKKRLREQILEKTAKEMTAKSELLEVRVKELEMEIKWLRGLIVEKDASRMLLQEDGGVGGGKARARSASSAFAPSAPSLLPNIASLRRPLAGGVTTSSLSSAGQPQGSAESSVKAPSRRTKKT